MVKCVLHELCSEIMEKALIPIFKSVKRDHDRRPAVIHLAILSLHNQYL